MIVGIFHSAPPLAEFRKRKYSSRFRLVARKSLRGGALAEDELAGFCHSIAFIWQIHPFYESLLGRGAASFDREELMCLPLFENPALLRNVDPTEALDTSKLA